MQFHFLKYFNSIITLFTFLTVLSCKSVKEAAIVPDNSLLNNADWGIDTSLFFSQNYGFSQSNIYLSRSANTYIPLHSPEIVETGYFKYLLYPKDHLLLHLDRNYKRMFISANVRRNKELEFFNTLSNYAFNFRADASIGYSSQDNLDKMPKRKKRVELLQFLYKDSMQKLFKHYCNNSKINKSFRKIMPYYINGLVMYNYYELYEDTLKSMGLYKEKSIELIPTLTSIKNSNQYTFSSWAVDYLNSIAEGITNQRIYKIKTQDQWIRSYDTINYYLPGISRDFVLTELMLKANDERIIIPEKYKNSFFAVCKTKAYKKLVLNQYRNQYIDNKTMLSRGDILQNTSDKELISIDDLIKKFSGKLVLIDFWASWCEPCLHEMQSMKQLQSIFKNDKIIVLSISLDKNINNWKLSVLNNNLPKATSFRFVDIKESAFVSKYNIQTIPRFILVGKDGKIISDDAPRPSDKALQELIEKNL